MDMKEVLAYLEAHGNEQTKKINLSHGAKEPLFGVKLGDLKALKKKIKVNHDLALELYQTGISDAMYLAGLIIDPNKVTIELLNEWVKKAYWEMLSERSVAVVAAKSKYGFDVAREWIKSDLDEIKCAGYATFSTMFTFLEDSEIDLEEVKCLLNDIAVHLREQSRRVQYTMNNFVVMAGIYIKPLYEFTLTIAEKVGRVEPLVAVNQCNVQTATDYLINYAKKGKIGVKIKNLNR